MSDGGAGALVEVVGGLSKSRAGRVILAVGAAYLALVGIGGSRDRAGYLWLAGIVAVVCAIGFVRAWFKRRTDQAITRSLLVAAGVAVLVVVGGVAGVILLFKRKKVREAEQPVSLPPVGELEALAQAEAREAA